MHWHQTALNTTGLTTTASIVVSGLAILVGSLGGEPWAAEDRCSHAACAFSTDGEFDGRVLVCDCHGSEFDVVSGDALTPPATESIRTFPTRVVDGAIEVYL